MRIKGDAATLVCYGSASSPAVAVKIARRCGYQQVLIPDYAASLAVVGMLIVDLVFELRADAPTVVGDLRSIREGFARLMDDAARQVTLEGYDIDDTIGERLVELADHSVLPVEAIKAAEGGCSPIRGLLLRVTIQTPKFALPGDGTGRLISIAV
jgi:N-methylhydantoinase A/oxoprolinase/acetone carboxylase beta subunit